VSNVISIGDNTLAEATLERLMHNRHRIKVKGESMRKNNQWLIYREQLG
jgi:DNA replication protein DnaC